MAIHYSESEYAHEHWWFFDEGLAIHEFLKSLLVVAKPFSTAAISAWRLQHKATSQQLHYLISLIRYTGEGEWLIDRTAIWFLDCFLSTPYPCRLLGHAWLIATTEVHKLIKTIFIAGYIEVMS